MDINDSEEIAVALIHGKTEITGVYHPRRGLRIIAGLLEDGGARATIPISIDSNGCVYGQTSVFISDLGGSPEPFIACADGGLQRVPGLLQTQAAELSSGRDGVMIGSVNGRPATLLPKLEVFSIDGGDTAGKFRSFSSDALAGEMIINFRYIATYWKAGTWTFLGNPNVDSRISWIDDQIGLVGEIGTQPVVWSTPESEPFPIVHPINTQATVIGVRAGVPVGSIEGTEQMAAAWLSGPAQAPQVYSRIETNEGEIRARSFRAISNNRRNLVGIGERADGSTMSFHLSRSRMCE